MAYNKIYKNVAKMNIGGHFNKWMRVMEYNSSSGASVAVNAIKNGKTDLPFYSDMLVAFTARTFDDKSRLYAYIVGPENKVA